ncbi:hypothetical protein Syun_006790 [Stephania yunnanensis]|uniref:Uncharacterized protein n=1 Tax=Stephania yunnanensis TaxID=152371 RepID=A0AAP0PZM9_9MAGN
MIGRADIERIKKQRRYERWSPQAAYPRVDRSTPEEGPRKSRPSPSPTARGGPLSPRSSSSPKPADGRSPWRPDAVMSTTGANDTGPPDFQGPPGRTDTTNVRCSSSSPDPTSAEPFSGRAARAKHAFDGVTPTLRSTNPCASAVHMEPSPLRPSKFSFEYLLLPPRSAPTEAPPARALGFTSLPPRPPTHRGLTIAPTAGWVARFSRHPFSGLVDSKQ